MAQNDQNRISNEPIEIRIATIVPQSGWIKTSTVQGKVIYLAPNVLFKTVDFEISQMSEESHLSTVDLHLKLSKTASQRFEDFTSSNRGKYLAILIEGRVHSVPKIVSSVSNGQVVVKMVPKKQANRIVDEILEKDYGMVVDVFIYIGYLGVGIVLCASIWTLVLAWQKSLGWFFLCFLIPIFQWVFIFKNWEIGKKPFMLYLLGLVIMLIMFFIFGVGLEWDS